MTRDISEIRHRLLSIEEHVFIDDPDKQDKLADLADAINRLEAGTYGKCIECGAFLGSESLLEHPTKALCDDCELENSWRPFSPR